MVAGIVWLRIEAALMAGCQTVLASPLLLCNSDCCLYKKILCVRIFFSFSQRWSQAHSVAPGPALPLNFTKQKLRFVFFWDYVRVCAPCVLFLRASTIENLFPVSGYHPYRAWVLLHPWLESPGRELLLFKGRLYGTVSFYQLCLPKCRGIALYVTLFHVFCVVVFSFLVRCFLLRGFGTFWETSRLTQWGSSLLSRPQNETKFLPSVVCAWWL